MIPNPASMSPERLSPKALLARVNDELVALRRALGHDHGDDAFWAAQRTLASRAQSMRHHLRWLANLLHVERANVHGHVHGNQFASLADQRAWLARAETTSFGAAGRWLNLPETVTLATLRAGEVGAS